MNYIICKPGERLKRIRIRINMKQSELSGKTITRNLVSMIENGKSALTLKTAIILSENINNFCKENNKTFSVTPQELMYSEQDQAKDISKEFLGLINTLGLDFLKFDSKTHLDKMREILQEYDLTEEKALIYERLGQLYSQAGQYDKSTTYLYLAYEYMSKIEIEDKYERLADIVLKLVHGKKNIRKYDEALNLSFSFKNSIFFEQCSRETQSRILYNNAVCMKKVMAFEDCLRELENLECNYSEEAGNIPFRLEEILILKANCKSELHYTGEAIRIHKSILPRTKNNVQYTLLTLCNLIEIYLKLKDSKNIKKILEESEGIIDSYAKSSEQKFYCEIFTLLGLGYEFIGKISQAEDMFIKTLSKARIRNDKYNVKTSLVKLIEIYTQINNEEKMDSIKNITAECYNMKLVDPSSRIVLLLIEYYNKKGNSEMIQNIIDFAK